MTKKDLLFALEALELDLRAFTVHHHGQMTWAMALEMDRLLSGVVRLQGVHISDIDVDRTQKKVSE